MTTVIIIVAPKKKKSLVFINLIAVKKPGSLTRLKIAKPECKDEVVPSVS